MSQRKESPKSPSAGSWATLLALSFLASLWALVLWSELVLAHSGGSPLCLSAGSGSCAALWDSTFAKAVHGATGLPIAGWGLAWGLAAFLMPLLGLLRQAEGRPFPPLVAATRFLAAGGVLGVLLLAGVSATEGTFCLGCFAFYALIAGYAGIALFGWTATPLKEPLRGAAIALGSLALAFALLLLPGQRTPVSPVDASRAAIERQAPSRSGGSEEALQELIGSLDPGLRQDLADALAFFRRQETKAMGKPRFLIGPAQAPVRITDFTDVLCPHCAELERALEAISKTAPPGSFSIEPRQFPLDGSCNPFVQRTGAPVRCLGARVKICTEGQPGTEALSRTLFDNQEGLSAERIFSLAEPYVSRKELEACVASDKTASRLRDDINYASEYSPDGTPIVLVNGRLAPSFPPLLLALILSKGDPADPAFDALPPPREPTR